MAAALGERLRRALDGFDDAGAHSVLDRLLGSYPLENVLRDAVLPYLHELGERWAHAEASVAQSTSPARSCAAVCSPWRAAGGAVAVRTHCSPAFPAINTI